MTKNEQQKECKSIFRSGESISKEQFTQKWIELINTLEKNKRIAAENRK